MTQKCPLVSHFPQSRKRHACRRSFPPDGDYVSVRNLNAKDGLWKVRGARQVIYAKIGLAAEEQSAAIKQLVD
jgi:hypothetical protein